MTSLPTTVLIVGVGPAGLATAIGLARRGIDFVIVDALAEAQNTSRAAVIHAATLEAVGGLGVTDRLIDQGIKARWFRVRDRDTVLLNTDFAPLPTPTPYALMIPQDETEQILISRLAELGHSVRRPLRLTALEHGPDGVKAVCESPQGPLTIKARYIVGADGEKSFVRSAAEIAFPGHTYGSFLLADVRMDWPIEKSEVTLFFSEAGTLVVAPMSGERYRVVAQLPDAPSNPTIADVEKIIAERGPRTGTGTGVSELLWGSRFQVHHKLADSFRKGPVLLVGDAAHVHSPAGGQGMNLGLRDAVALSQALADAIETRTQTPLETYAADRRAAAARILDLTDHLTRVATLSNPTLRWLRNRLIATLGTLPAIQTRAARTLAGFEH
ncbi:FAD-dependent monooxygenase [Pelagibacterium mangrovi]|uniref:FAD-dependent monooxygenase n=1 Tax=Pelagibacterium mangrovi TaxID=3119828 RepID=UPI002FC7F987